MNNLAQKEEIINEKDGSVMRYIPEGTFKRELKRFYKS